jgi:serine/threonine protein kinase
MPAPASSEELLDLIRRSGVAEEKRLDAHLEKLRAAGALPPEPAKLAAILVRDGLLTNFQSEQLLQGKWKRFTIGKYKVLERLGSGGMGQVFLCEHKFMRRRVAVKVLPTAKAADPSSLERFYREAKAVAAVDHPNVVRAYDIDQDENLHFLVMEYVEGASLQDVVRRSGPLGLERACHYISQAAQALDHANKVGLVHRDVKPGNILVDRTGVVKILDMGLARFFNDDEDILTRKYDENVLGTADYLAPEQADDSHGVDVRADIYSLGGTFYFLLTGRTPFGEGSVPQKLMWHRTRQPKPVSAYREDVPAAVQAVLDKMMAKEPGQRYQQPMEITAALADWTQSPVPPPTEEEMPRLSPAASGVNTSAGSGTTITNAPSPPPSSATARKNWQVSGAPVSPGPAAAPAPAPPKSPAPAPRRPVEVPLSPTIVVKNQPRGSRAAVAARPGPKVDESALADPAADTADPSARGDTPPQTPARPRPAKPAPATARFTLSPRVVLLLGGGGLAVIALLVLVVVAYLLGFLGK